ncbi:hypothetical protein ABH935_008107 [Catenulispora sp. GAS73]|uniref:hypothetical protein n=1 Tax=Catenulispora sp. GAS73 TaxID=3156269 RepID=UPI003510F685
MDGGSMSTGAKLAGGCAVIVAVPLVWLGVSVYSTEQNMEPESQPDVVKAAQSAIARSADQAVSAQVDSRIGQVRAALPWAAYLGTTVADVCRTVYTPSAFFGARSTWSPVTCTRTDTVYEAFDGDFKQRLAQLDGALDGAGWRPQGQVVLPKQERPGLVAELDTTSQVPRDADSSQIAAAALRSNVVKLTYYVPITNDFTPPTGTAAYADKPCQVEVTRAPHLPDLDDGTSDHDRALKDPSAGTSYYRAWQPYSPAQVATAYPAHSGVIAITLSVRYGTGG